MSFPTEMKLTRLHSHHAVKFFDCGDSDLNDFCLNDAKISLENLLTVTYLLETSDRTVAFFSLLHDKISKQDADSSVLGALKNLMPVEKRRYASYPAMKIARLGVAIEFQKSGIGTLILDHLKALFSSSNQAGCRFITVDAYQASLNFYRQNGFQFLKLNDQGRLTRLMYFDLLPIRNSLR